MNGRLRDLLFGVLGAASLALGVFVADWAFDDGGADLPEPETGFAVSAGAETPGGVITEVTVPGPEPLFPDATPLLPTSYDEEGIPVPEEPPASSEAPSGGSPQGGGGTPSGQGSQGTPAAPASGSAGSPGSQAGNTIATIVRFLDFCAEATTPGCPLGIGATVLLAGSAPPLQIEVIPEATTALQPGLRCDPGWPSATVVPVAIISNRPFSLLHVRLSTADGTLVDEVVNQKSAPSEHTLYDKRVKENKLMWATVASGFHTCVQFHLDRKLGEPTPRGSSFEIFVQGYADQDYLAKTVKFSGQYQADRPPVRIHPLDENRAYLVVPQLADDTTVAWVYEESESWRHRANGPRGCEGTPPPLDTRSTRRSPLAAPVPFSGTNAADYPWDRSYSHYTIWDLDLKSAENYTLCVRWMKEDRTEEWNLLTPDGVEVEIVSGPLRHTRTRVAGTLLVHLLGIPNCFVADPQPYQGQGPGQPFPYRTVYGDGTDTDFINADMCDSDGRRIGNAVELRALFPDGSNTVYGATRIFKTVLIDHCGAEGQSDALRRQAACDRQLEWRNPNVLCGGGLYNPSCQGDLWFGLEVRIYSQWRRNNHRPVPTDWGITRIARLGEGSATAGL